MPAGQIVQRLPGGCVMTKVFILIHGSPAPIMGEANAESAAMAVERVGNNHDPFSRAASDQRFAACGMAGRHASAGRQPVMTQGGAVAARVAHNHQVAGSSPAPATSRGARPMSLTALHASGSGPAPLAHSATGASRTVAELIKTASRPLCSRPTAAGRENKAVLGKRKKAAVPPLDAGPVGICGKARQAATNQNSPDASWRLSPRRSFLRRAGLADGYRAWRSGQALTAVGASRPTSVRLSPCMAIRSTMRAAISPALSMISSCIAAFNLSPSLDDQHSEGGFQDVGKAVQELGKIVQAHGQIVQGRGCHV